MFTGTQMCVRYAPVLVDTVYVRDTNEREYNQHDEILMLHRQSF